MSFKFLTFWFNFFYAVQLIAQANLIHTKGCILLFEEWIRAHLFSIASFLMILAIMQVTFFMSK